MLRSTLSIAFSIVFLFSGAISAQSDYHDNPAFKKAIESAKHRHLWDEMAADYMKANDISKNQCDDCLMRAARLYISVKDFKMAGKVAKKLQQMPTASKQARADALVLEGIALVEDEPESAKPAALEKAHALYQQSLQEDPTVAQTLYRDGIVLAALGRSEDATEAFHRVTQMPSATAWMLSRAQRFQAHPELSTAKLVPPFTMKLESGETITSESLIGRVVVIAFIAPNGGYDYMGAKGPFPSLMRLYQEFGANKRFVLINAYVGSNAEDGTRFIAKFRFPWAQYVDRSFTIGELFHHPVYDYVVIDANGGIQDRAYLDSPIPKELIRKLLSETRAK